MARVVLNLALIAGILTSPLVCCCSVAAIPRQTDSDCPKQCCHKSTPERQPQPAAPQDSGCPCKQKEPKAVPAGKESLAGWASKGTPFEFTGPALVTDYALAASASPSASPAVDTVLPAGWFATSQDVLRALRTYRL